MDVAPQKIMEAEADLVGPRRRLVDAYIGMNALGHVEGSHDRATLGIVASGTTYDAVRQALVDLGLDDERLRSSRVRLLRLGMVWPLSPSTVKAFAKGLETLLVVEDKTPFIESQIREILYGHEAAPIVVGKLDDAGDELIPSGGELTAGRLVRPLRRQLGLRPGLRSPLPPPLPLEPLPAKRAAYFCSGCPHNRSTGLPEGSIGAGGIGCHILVTMSGRADSAVTGLTQMGGEGAQWIGQAPFTEVGHTFQNLGDGTLFHSGQLAIQACVAAGVNVTYKLLYNEVVAMTGAQEAAGMLTVPDLTHKLKREGVARIIVCADQPPRYRQRDLAEGTLLWERDRLDDAQRVLRDVAGVTVLIYDQHCAADARRKRKRGELPPRSTRVVINEAVCEGCGDCGVKSNCLSVQPIETEFGTKTRIDQTSCNTDYTCLDGDCPAFVTVHVPEENSRRESSPSSGFAGRPERQDPPVPPVVPEPVVSRSIETRNVLLAGIGGTGIVTVNQVLATAALRAGFEVAGLDQIGLSQKAGPVVSHLRFSAGALEPANRLSPGSADCILAFDLLAAADIKNLEYGARERTVVVASTSRTPTGDMVYDRSIAYPEEWYLLDRLRRVSAALTTMDALAAADVIFGDATAANFLVVGAAFQSGSLGLPAAAIEEAIAINGVAVQENIDAFRWGRAAVANPEVFEAAAMPKVQQRSNDAVEDLFDDTILTGETLRRTEIRASELVPYQSERMARRYVEIVRQVWDAERAVTEATAFSEAVSSGLYKFMAYKDEYEVARLLTDPGFVADVQTQLPGAVQLTYRLHPPVFRAMGLGKKIALTPRVHLALRVLAKGRVLRGTRLDPFGYARVRRVERKLLSHYTDLVTTLAAELTAENYADAVGVARLADVVRGYEDIKLANIAKYCERLSEFGIEPPDVLIHP
ncbi:indolepyruvate ferredoxin oxidoreductase [Rhodococcus sp. BE178]